MHWLQVLSERIIIKDFYGNRIKIGDTVIPVLKDNSWKVPGIFAEFVPGSMTPYRVDYNDPVDWIRAAKVIKCNIRKRSKIWIF